MVRKTMLEQNVEAHMKEGYKVFKYGKGMSSTDKRSKMGRTTYDCRLAHPKSHIRGIIGGRAGQNWNDGYHWAVVYKGK